MAWLRNTTPSDRALQACRFLISVDFKKITESFIVALFKGGLCWQENSGKKSNRKKYYFLVFIFLKDFLGPLYVSEKMARVLH